MKKRIALLSLLALMVTGLAFGTCLIDFWTEGLPLFYVGTPYSFQIDVCCGTAPYTFTVYSGTLPAGLSMNSSGLITGTPTVHNFNDTFCVTVTDAVGCHLTRCYDVNTD